MREMFEKPQKVLQNRKVGDKSKKSDLEKALFWAVHHNIKYVFEECVSHATEQQLIQG